MTQSRILIIDSNDNNRLLVVGYLSKRGYIVTPVSSTDEGIMSALSHKPDLIVLDIDTPDMDGIHACQEIRRNLTSPIIILSARTGESDVVLGLSLGGDIYLKKPFSAAELVAYVDAAIRREQLYRQDDVVIKMNDLTLDLSAHELFRDGVSIPLSITEFKLFEVLAKNAGRTLSRDQLLDYVWDMKSDEVYSRTIDVHIARIRKKLGDDCISQRYIKTIPGLGYKLIRP